MRRRTSWMASTVALVLLGQIVGSPSPSLALGPLRTLRALAQRIVSFEPPAGWERAASAPSARMLGTWAHRDGGRLTVAADRVAATTTASGLFDQSKKSLEKQGWALGHLDRQPNRVLVDANLDGGKRIARQLYLVADGFAYVITMVAPADQKDERGHDFDEAVASLELGDSDERK